MEGRKKRRKKTRKGELEVERKGRERGARRKYEEDGGELRKINIRENE